LKSSCMARQVRLQWRGDSSSQDDKSAAEDLSLFFWGIILIFLNVRAIIFNSLRMSSDFNKLTT
jgi:hypothetical protein